MCLKKNQNKTNIQAKTYTFVHNENKFWGSCKVSNAVWLHVFRISEKMQEHVWCPHVTNSENHILFFQRLT